MIQKVLKVGDSAAVTISKEALKALKLKIGDKVITTSSEQLGIMVVKSAKNKTPINLDLIAWTKSFIEQYGVSLKSLTRK
jgi:antitoxin component of MazEF toxin-antitoxin module